MDTLHHARRSGMEPDRAAWALQRAPAEHVEDQWHEPDEGIWEVRSERRNFAHSKVMAWVAMDRAVGGVALTDAPYRVSRSVVGVVDRR